jgi:hypothetical protein
MAPATVFHLFSHTAIAVPRGRGGRAFHHQGHPHGARPSPRRRGTSDALFWAPRCAVLPFPSTRAGVPRGRGGPRRTGDLPGGARSLSPSAPFTEPKQPMVEPETKSTATFPFGRSNALFRLSHTARRSPKGAAGSAAVREPSRRGTVIEPFRALTEPRQTHG